MFTKLNSAIAIAVAAAALPAVAQTGAPTQKLPSGVEVTHLKVGDGARPVAADTVRVHYEGQLADGTVFDSSYKRGQPASFPLKGVIPCWTEGVQTMAIGGKARLLCPPSTAYGSRGAGGVVPPNAELTFTVELLGIGK